MSFILLLLFAFICASLFHLAIILKPIINIAIVPFFSIEKKSKIKYSYHPVVNRIGITLSIIFFIGPLIIFKEYKSFEINNGFIDTPALLLLIALTIYLTHFSKFKIWSKNFRKVENPKDKLELKLERILTISDRRINNSQDILKSYKELISKNTQHIRNQNIKLNSSIQIFKHSENKIKNSHEINVNLENIKKNSLFKLKTKNNTESKPFKEYFKNEDTFREFENLLRNNFYYKDKKYTAINYSILMYKLESLGIIIRSKIDKYYCLAAAEYFNVKKIDAGQYSKVKTNFITNASGETHQEFFNKFKYLNKLKQK